MMFPVRCFTCGKVIGHLWEDYQKRVASGEDPKQVLDSLNVKRICCRRMFISHVDYIDELLSYSRGLSLGEDYRQ
ncbi:MAG: DNA-directed RNA polymerase subunit N [Thermoproteota archaeon]|nr:DNA-directed RNA polymerase subunit N [Candidatus Brockarchaeota archaeon]